MQRCLPRFARTSALCHPQTAAVLRSPGCSTLPFRPQDSSQAEKHSYSPSSSLPGWLVVAESRLIPTGDEPKNTEIKQRNILFNQIVPFTSWVQDAPKKPCFLVAHMEAGCLGRAPSTAVSESLNVTSSWDRFHHQGCALLCHSSPQQPLGNEWHS